MKIKTREEFVNESTAPKLFEADHKFQVAIDVENPEKIVKAIEELGGKVKEKLPFGIILIDAEDEIVSAIKKIDGVQYVSDQKDAKK